MNQDSEGCCHTSEGIWQPPVELALGLDALGRLRIMIMTLIENCMVVLLEVYDSISLLVFQITNHQLQTGSGVGV